MDAIHSNNINLLNNNSKEVTLVTNKSIIDENLNKNNTNKTITKTDSIEINQKNENLLNKKRASEAFDDACSEFYQKTDSEGDSPKIGIKYFVICSMMKRDGINVPSFNLNDNKEDSKFIEFIDKMKDYVQKNDIIEGNIPINKNEILDFCDLYKKKLVKYGCK